MLPVCPAFWRDKSRNALTERRGASYSGGVRTPRVLGPWRRACPPLGRPLHEGGAVGTRRRPLVVVASPQLCLNAYQLARTEVNATKRISTAIYAIFHACGQVSHAPSTAEVDCLTQMRELALDNERATCWCGWRACWTATATSGATLAKQRWKNGASRPPEAAVRRDPASPARERRWMRPLFDQGGLCEKWAVVDMHQQQWPMDLQCRPL